MDNSGTLMPVYEFRCTECAAITEELRAFGQDLPPDCPKCTIPMRRKFSRVAVRYGTWGFTATDSLVRDTRGKDYKQLRSKAEQIADE